MIKVFEAFAGIGTQRMALRNLGIEHEVVAISEIDKFAIKSYEAIHGVTRNLGDITKIKIEDIPDHDLFTYSFPCQDISTAGKMAGLNKDSGTRSSLLWECERIIEAKKPKYLLMENVKNLVSKKFKPYFEEWLKVLENLGYSNYWQVLNAKDYGIPQNRERVFVVSILGDNVGYQFPTKIPLTLKLKDILEDSVDESFYLTQAQVDRIKFSTYNTNKKRIQKKDYSDTLCARDYKDPKCVEVNNATAMIGGIGEKNFGKQYRQGNRVYDSEGVAACLQASQIGGTGGYSSLYAVNKNYNKVKQIGRLSNTKRDNPQRYRVYDQNYIAPTLNTMQGGGLQPFVNAAEIRTDIGFQTYKGDYVGTLRAQNSGGDKVIITHNPQFGSLKAKNEIKGTNSEFNTDYLSVRKLTPLECWRLMGISDEDFYKAQAVNSNSQLYKQAGNAIVVDVLEVIFSNMSFG